MSTLFFKFLFKTMGWKVTGIPPKTMRKSIWIVAPHYSNQDFFLGLGVRATIGFDIGFLGKKELFTWYSGWLFRALGGHAVNRSQRNNLVESVSDMFRKADDMHIAIAPEGKRKDTDKIKTGFYHMALRAGVPLVLVGINNPEKILMLSAPLFLSGDYQKDMKIMYDYYLTIPGPKKSWLTNYAKTGLIPPMT
ncbi:1-acyl-sn-glycerol-3-phosphate acyltransferase [Arundinibacter roseus]|uniref:Glycerol acyltransferase n=1 Tax=Arundinibacter roseus TaxID=2070510 RepID=A0A4R4KFL5_9BACT|nr:1-acyl-sn-glycerol-3-phosphate acyltransferase [Arundinibacter roseus]TDB66764.1 glycerol acyltransferase [Arundinibacter roseus]